MEAILFLARWHTFFTGARAINAVARVSFRVVTRHGTAGRRVQFLSWRNGRRFNENTGGRISMGGKNLRPRTISPSPGERVYPSRPNEWDKKRADNRKIDFEIKNRKLSATLMICSANYMNSRLEKITGWNEENKPFYIAVFVRYNESVKISKKFNNTFFIGRRERIKFKITRIFG